MKLEEVYEKLCSSDPRNPLFNDIFGDDDEAPAPRKGCFCDNCFRGNDKLALEILRLREINTDLLETLRMLLEVPHKRRSSSAHEHIDRALAALIDHMADPINAAEKLLEENPPR